MKSTFILQFSKKIATSKVLVATQIYRLFKSNKQYLYYIYQNLYLKRTKFCIAFERSTSLESNKYFLLS